MNQMAMFLIGIAWLSVVKSFIILPYAKKFVCRSETSLYEIPLELTGQLDSSKTWDVTFLYNGEEKV